MYGIFEVILGQTIIALAALRLLRLSFAQYPRHFIIALSTVYDLDYQLTRRITSKLQIVTH